MARILVIADDLTGANATGARFARTGSRVVTVAPEHVAGVLDDHDVVVANIDSRNLPADQAADLVTDVIEAGWPVGLVVKRVDSTLRGNVGAEIEAAWHAVRERTPARTRVRVLLSPAFPAAGRGTSGGRQMLDGVPLERTELAMDPLNPVRTSVVADIVAEQSALAVRHLPLRRSDRALLAAELSAGEEPVVLCDALTDTHLTDLTQAAADVHRRDGTVWVVADPGASGPLLAEALGLRGQAAAVGPLLAVGGSTTDLTRRQSDAFLRANPARVVDVDAVRLGHDENYQDDRGTELAKALSTSQFPDVVLVRVTTLAADVAGLPLRDRTALPGLLAELVGAAVGEAERDSRSSGAPSGLYISGGEATATLLDELGVHGCAIGGEIVPLVVYGTLSGGRLDGVPMIVKGGLVGDDTTMADCVDRLRRVARGRLRHVRAEVPEHVMLLGGGPG